MTNLALLGSGGGSTIYNTILACRDGRIGMNPVLVVASRGDAGLIEKARLLGAHCEICSPRNTTPAAFGHALLNLFDRYHIGFFAQCGWLPTTPEAVVQEYQQRGTNQHPASLDTGHPDFGGKGMYGHAAHAARKYFLELAGRPPEDWWTEATVQYVGSNVDEGGLISWRRMPIFPNDTPEVIANQLIHHEHQLVVATLARVGRGEKIAPIARATRLILRGEEGFLAEAKARAIRDYPHG